MRTFAATGTLALLLALTGCGDDDDTDVAVPDAEEVADDPQGALEDMSEGLEDLTASEGGGSATITIGDETWEFDAVLCAFGSGETGRDDTEFVLSSTQDGLQLDATINTEFGHSVSLNDIEDFENPRVSYSAGGPLAALTGGEEDIIEVDGKNVSATGSFIDDTNEEAFEGVEGTLTGTCP